MINAINEYIKVKASREDGIDIPAAVTVPQHNDGEKCPVAVLGHGFLGSKDEEFGFYANNTDETYEYPSIAGELLSLGIGTIRLDFPGHGDSEDEFRNYTLSNCLSDIQDVYDFCMSEYDFDREHAAYVGWSMGGKIGAEFIDCNSEIRTVVLLNPAGDNGNNSLITAKEACLDWAKLEVEAVQNGKVFNQAAHESGLEDAVMSYDYFKEVDESLSGDKIKSFAEKPGNKGLLIYGDCDCVINPTTYEWLKENSGLEYVCIPGMDHDLGLETDRPDFTRTVVDLTVSYINRFI